MLDSGHFSFLITKLSFHEGEGCATSQISVDDQLCVTKADVSYLYLEDFCQLASVFFPVHIGNQGLGCFPQLPLFLF